MQRRKFYLFFSIFSALTLLIYSCDNQKGANRQSSVQTEKGQESKPKKKQVWLSILGGAVGGTFSPFAGGIGTVVSKAEPNIRISVEASAGSIENVRRVNSGEDYMGVAFASDVYLGYHGQEVFAKEGRKENIRVLTLLYIAYNQFVTLENSDVHQFEDIVGKKVAMGAAGSGSAQTLERLAKLAGIHGKFAPVYKGGTAGADALRDGQVSGFQWLVNAPNSAIIYVSEIKSVRLIDFDTPAKKYGFYEKYPFYLPGRLPEKAYKDVQPVNTFLMPTVLIAHKNISEETAHTILQRMYDQAGHQTLITTTPAAKDMTLENAPKAFVIPLHRGADRFWKERGVEIPEAAQAID